MNSQQNYQKKLVAAQELASRVDSTGQRLKINSDASITLFHTTSHENFESIMRDGQFKGNTWFAATRAATLVHVQPKYGRTTVTLEIHVDPEDIEFSTGTGEFYAPNGLKRNEHGQWSDAQAEQNRQDEQDEHGQTSPVPGE